MAPRGWRLVGGHPALDLANTSAWRLDPPRRRDDLSDPATAERWLRQVLGPGLDRVAADDRAELSRLRDAVIDVLDARVAGTPPPSAAWGVVAERARAAIAAAELAPGGPARWLVPAEHPQVALHRLSLAALDLLQGPDLDRLQRCEGTGCGWFFLDRTRNHSRRWCASDDCGNRTRVRAYARRQAGGPAGPE